MAPFSYFDLLATNKQSTALFVSDRKDIYLAPSCIDHMNTRKRFFSLLRHRCPKLQMLRGLEVNPIQRGRDDHSPSIRERAPHLLRHFDDFVPLAQRVAQRPGQRVSQSKRSWVTGS